MSITQRHTATKPNATGILAPLCRAATHIGYIVGLAEKYTDEEWPTKRDEIKKELEDTLLHMEAGLTPNHKTFVGDTVAALYSSVTTDITTMKDNVPATKNEALRDSQVLNANIAYTAAMYERAMTGEDVDEGSAP